MTQTNDPASPASQAAKLQTIFGMSTSVVTSAIMVITAYVVGWMQSHHLIPANSVSDATAFVSTAIGGAVIVVFGYIKTRNYTPAAKIAAVKTLAPEDKVKALSEMSVADKVAVTVEALPPGSAIVTAPSISMSPQFKDDPRVTTATAIPGGATFPVVHRVAP